MESVAANFILYDGEDLIIDTKKSQGSWIIDAKTGKKYLDCNSQFASQALGWNHPELICHQERLGQIALHKIANSDYYTEEFLNFIGTFSAITPFPHHFFIEGGTLGVENALKAAFDWKAKISCSTSEDWDVIHLERAFHGRSGYTLSLTNTTPEKTALYPKFNWTRVPNPKIHFPIDEADVGVREWISLQHTEEALKTDKVAAIILEPIQSEGGDNHFRKEYLETLRYLAWKYNAMLIFDEVQTGIGLTGKMWAYEHFDVVPDMLCFGKKTQVCGFCCSDRIDEVKNNVFQVSSRINSTWGGNIVDMVRCSIILEIIKKENLVENAKIVGSYFLEKLKTLPRITNVRGRGLLLAFDLEDKANRDDVLTKLKQYMTILPCGEKSIRIRPHLTFSQADVDVAVDFIKLTI